MEIRAACKAMVKQHQLSRITTTIRKSFRHLQPYEDEQGILRCRGRLGRSDLDEQAKFPMLVLQKTWLSKLIIMDCHRELHTGISHTMCRVRERYWIPKLRAEVTTVIRRCMGCQKMNNLPYKYPDQGHLPARRVTRSRPFEHIGLDYFGPLSVKGEAGPEKCYGCIITCLVTRLIHLELASDVSTIAFLHMLRRFFARRGIPKSITSDNAPTFALGGAILSQWLDRAKDDPTIAKEISSRQIQWTYNTPYAPWQGGVYERLIRSVKLAINKSLGKVTPSREELGTLIVEIESMLNTRPLLYVESEEGSERVLRPIDLLQNEFEVLPPMQTGDDLVEDQDYLTPAERLASQTKLQVVQAIDSSCRITEQFWQQWQSQYLTSLREKHQKEVGHRRGSRIAPKVGQVVLICVALQPRYMWKMGRIDELVANKEGVVREASVMLPSRRKIRRPLKLLVPLELDDTSIDVDTESTSQQHPESSPAVVEGKVKDSQPVDTELPRYNFRPTRRVDYRKLARSNLLPVVSVTWVSVNDPVEQIPAMVSDDEQDPGDLNLQPIEGSEPDLAEAEDVVRDEQQEDVENSGLGPEARVQQDEAEEADPEPEVRVQQVNIEEMDPGTEVRVGERCRCRHKRCFDCQRIEETAFEDLIPNDEGHHWALGNVLHKELRIQELEDDGQRLTLEDNGRRLTGLWQFFSEQRDQQGRRTTSTRTGVTTSRLL
ncbi:unnamed protein product [Heligmosomoides polygyrus]|uniref:Integrase catalytic domain-containing protein n=1 Tax=Heligmosomoides polygyrus TaxID=6339 RepID=A0A183FXC6_HELPZ|nr:unnamed protein product [Heligmosomoides polygyrus]